MAATPSIAAVAVVGGAAALIAAVSLAANGSHQPDTPPGTTATWRRATPRPSAPVNQGIPVPSPAGDRSASGGGKPGPFTLTVSMRSATISATVAPISVASHQVVDPPHHTARQWNTAAWVQQSTYPATPANGTSYVYGHACHYHLCPFTNLKDARPGDQVRVNVPAGLRVYTIVRSGLSPKTATSLPPWASDSTVPNRVVLVTCAYQEGDTSTENIVVVARLTRGGG